VDRSPLPRTCEERFQWVRPLASGGFGSVHLCLQRGLDRQVVVKLLHGEALADPEQVGRFLAEARITAAIEHPHVVRVIDHGAGGDVPWIAYELVPGQNLRQLLAGGALSPAQAVRATLHVLAALGAAHERGVVHRDVKPENVLEVDGTFKVTDFGIAKWTRDTGVRTKTGIVLGTPAYMAPELIRGEHIGPAADVYSTGAMLHELLAGEPPFHHDNPIKLLELHLSHAPPPLPEAVRDHAPGLERVLRRALEKDPRARYATAAEMAADLSRLKLGDTPAGLPAVRTSETKAVSWRATVASAWRSSGQFARRTRWALSAFVLLAVAGLVWAIAQRPAPPPPAPPLDVAAEVDAMAAETMRVVNVLRPLLLRRIVKKLKRESADEKQGVVVRANLAVKQTAQIAALQALAARARRLGGAPLTMPLESVQLPYAYVLMTLAHYEELLSFAKPPVALEGPAPASHWVGSLMQMQRHAVQFAWPKAYPYAHAVRVALAGIQLDRLTPAGEQLLDEVISIEGETGFPRVRGQLDAKDAKPADLADGWAFLSFALAFAEHQARLGGEVTLGIEPLSELVEMLRPAGLFDTCAERVGERAHVLGLPGQPGGVRRDVLVRRLRFWRAALPFVLAKGRGARIGRRVESVLAGGWLACAADTVREPVDLPETSGASDATLWAVGVVQALRKHVTKESLVSMKLALDARDAFERDVRERDLSPDDVAQAVRLRVILLKFVSAAHAKPGAVELDRVFPDHPGHDRCCAFYLDTVARRRTVESKTISTTEEIAGWNVALGCTP
jgi:hypothetical protein